MYLGTAFIMESIILNYENRAVSAPILFIRNCVKINSREVTFTENQNFLAKLDNICVFNSVFEMQTVYMVHSLKSQCWTVTEKKSVE